MLNNDGSSGLRKWLLRLPNFFAAVILLQTLFFKFTDAPVSVYIFTELGMEPWGRYGSGVAELIAAVLLLVPRYSWMGAVLAMGIMAGGHLRTGQVIGATDKHAAEQLSGSQNT